MNGRDVQPSIRYYGLAVLIIVIGFAAFAWSIYSGISSLESSLMQLKAPGGADFDLTEPGEYTIFYENHSYFNGRFYNTAQSVQGLQIKVSEKKTGQTLATYASPSSSTYSMGGRTGRSVAAFMVERPGIYHINASYPQGPGPEVILAVGKEFAEGIFYLIIISVALLFGSIAIAAVVTYVTYTRRKEALQSQREEERLIKGERG